jgi:C4-dicarboxylate-specific signal transduction histidine kinase
VTGAPLLTLRAGRGGSEEHLEQVLRECVGNLLDGRPEVCIANLTHAVQLALGLDDHGPGAVPDSVRVLLEVIVAKGGGFA